jgi:hypothetical protein
MEGVLGSSPRQDHLFAIVEVEKMFLVTWMSGA